MKNHLKRIAVPKTWIINRKNNVFITRPNPGAHAFENGLPLGILLRDNLKVASTMTEVKKILNNNDVLVDGTRRKDHHFIVGLFDVLSIPTLKKHYRIIFDNKGRIITTEIDEKESTIKLCKITGKTALSKGKIQFNFHDGKNLVTDIKAKVNDTLLMSLPKLEVKEILPLSEGATVFLTKGKHSGDVGTLKKLNVREAIFSKENKDVGTAKGYLFVVGKNKPAIKIN